MITNSNSREGRSTQFDALPRICGYDRLEEPKRLNPRRESNQINIENAALSEQDWAASL